MGTAKTLSSRVSVRADASCDVHCADAGTANGGRTGTGSAGAGVKFGGSRSALPGAMPHHNGASLTARLRRAWRKINDKDASGRRTKLGAMLAAFKMGIYVKVIVSLLLVGRLGSHWSQMTFPHGAISREEHFSHLASSQLSPALRIVVMTQVGDSDHLQTLLSSLSEADYAQNNVALDVWMFASSTCSMSPLPFYPLAVVVFGPPRFDHSIANVFQAARWTHGTKTLIAVRSEADWAGAWLPNHGTENETLLFVDATTARAVSPAYYVWLQKAHSAAQRGMLADIGAFALDALAFPGDVPAGDGAVVTEAFFPSTSMFSPTRDAWVTFLKWHHLRTRTWFARPTVPPVLRVYGYSIFDSLRVHPLRAWFCEFLYLYQERVVHPVLPDRQSMVLRGSGSTGPSVKGTGGAEFVHLDRSGEVRGDLYGASGIDIVVPEKPVVVKWSGAQSDLDMPFGGLNVDDVVSFKSVSIQDLVSEEMMGNYAQVLRQVADFARSRGGEAISFTLVTDAFVDTTFSWLCNVIALDIVPPALVLVTSDDRVAKRLRDVISRHPRVLKSSLVVSMSGAVSAVKGAKGSETAMHFGSTEYWLLMLERTILLRDLLDRGVSVLHFETDQIWLSDPIPYIRHALHSASQDMSASVRSPTEDATMPNMVVTLNTGGEVSGNFFYLRASVATRHLWTTVVNRFYRSYKELQKRKTKRGEMHYIENDQSLLTTLVLGHDGKFKQRFPGVKYTVLDKQLFVDGRWFLDYEDVEGRDVKTRKFYTSQESLLPVVLNNNFLIGVEAKMQRAKRFGFWFWQKEEETCDAAAVKKAAASGSARERRDAPVVEIGIRRGH